MTQRQLQALCRKWQVILRLQDWDVEIVFVRQSEIDDSDARVYPVLSRKEAKIKVLDPVDIYGERMQGADSPDYIETLVIHELLHLHYEPFWSEEHETTMEQSIHSLAKSFQKLSSASLTH